MANYFARGTQWHQAHNVPISKYVVPHFYEMGTNVFGGLRDWGVEFLGIQMDPGRNYYGSSWIQNGPYRRFDTCATSAALRH